MEPFGDKSRRPLRADAGKQVLGGGDDILGRDPRGRRAGLLHNQAKMLEIVLAEFESNSQPHPIAPATVPQRRLP